MKKWLLFVVIFFAFLFIGCSSDQPNNSSNDNEIKEYVTVIFDSQSGSDVSSQQVEKGSKITKPADPTKEGYKFLGWFNERGEKIEEITEIDFHYILKAMWKELNPVTDVNVSGIEEVNK